MKLELNSTPQEVMRAVELLQEYAMDCDIPEKIIFGLALALEECGSNIVNHALKGDPQKKFHLTISFDRNRMLMEFRDGGPAFDPAAFNVNNRQPADDEPGGWGIRLVRKYIDEIRYTRQGNENVLLLIKHIDEPATRPKTL